MKCPACDRELTEITVDGIVLDVCKGGCGGVWFDWFELQKVDEPHESAGEHVLEIERDPSVQVDHSKRRHCPRCKDMIMMRHFASVKREVEVDECPKCAGFWLDDGELAAIRGQFSTEEERKTAAGKHFAALFDQDLKEMRQESEEKAKKARSIAKMFRFFLPSYYIPGKQKWGAF